jgi:hypothetical protein
MFRFYKSIFIKRRELSCLFQGQENLCLHVPKQVLNGRAGGDDCEGGQWAKSRGIRKKKRPGNKESSMKRKESWTFN